MSRKVFTFRHLKVTNYFKYDKVIVLVRIKALFFLLLTSGVTESYAQSLPVGSVVLEEHVRRKQLTGETDSTLSFLVRPIRYTPSDSLLDINLASRHFKWSVLPVVLRQQVNTGKPYGWNDGLMVPAQGYQVHVSAGAYIQYGPLSIQLQPEFNYAVNPNHFDQEDQQAALRYETEGINAIGDFPVLYPEQQLTKAGLGQSTIRLIVGPISFGISNENLWWGPGRKNALLMSNNARGFQHLTLNTIRPVNIGIGHLEGQIIAGKLENSSSAFNLTKSDEWRYLSGMTFSYQPKWLKGLFVGLTRSFQMYHSDVKSLGDYVPLFQAFEKRKTSEDTIRRDQLTSIFFRLVLPQAKMEFYGEYGRNDHAFSLRDFAQQPQHSRAYLIGAQKLVDLGRPEEQLLIGFETTQMAQSLSRILRDAGTWYTHSQITQGYTHYGEVLGAGTGPGSNIQTLEVSWLKGLNKIGLQLERYEHNRDYYHILDPENVLKGQWIDLSIGALVDWNYKNLLISSKIIGVQSMNYLWQSGLNGTANKDPFNLHVNVGLAYYFKSREQTRLPARQGAKSKD